MKSGSVYSTWWNGGLRTTAYYHNIIGLLTEIIGDPTPENIPLVPSRLIPNSATPFPITPRKWFFKNSIDYSLCSLLKLFSIWGAVLYRNNVFKVC